MSTTLSPQKSLIFLVNRVARQMATLALQDLEFDGWKPQGTHMAIIADLLEKDGVRQQDLAVSTIKDKATITRGLQGLEREKIIDRRINPNDRRNKLIYLTKKGHCLKAAFAPMIQQTMHMATTGIDPDQLAQCRQVLNQIYINLQQNINSTSTSDEQGK
ncbi:MAG: MarR family winged helix-turn-helix transcriptional regulator [Bacteroidota bacterium]